MVSLCNGGWPGTIFQPQYWVYRQDATVPSIESYHCSICHHSHYENPLCAFPDKTAHFGSAVSCARWTSVIDGQPIGTTTLDPSGACLEQLNIFCVVILVLGLFLYVKLVDNRLFFF